MACKTKTLQALILGTVFTDLLGFGEVQFGFRLKVYVSYSRIPYLANRHGLREVVFKLDPYHFLLFRLYSRNDHSFKHHASLQHAD